MIGNHGERRGVERGMQPTVKLGWRRGATIAMATAVAVTLASGAGCGGASDRGPVGGAATAPAGRSPTSGGGSDDDPLSLVVRAGRSAVLAPFSFCSRGMCGDGLPPDPLPDLGAAPQVAVESPGPGWRFTASVTPVNRPVGEGAYTPLLPAADGTFVPRPPRPSRTYSVVLASEHAGARPEGGTVAFRWTATGPAQPGR
jgi:hypothetical protein